MGMDFLTDSVTEDQEDHEAQTIFILIWKEEINVHSYPTLSKNNATLNLSSLDILV